MLERTRPGFVSRIAGVYVRLRILMDRIEEKELLTRCQTGNHAAWDTLFDLHYPAVTRFVFQLNSSLTREDVEEICQESFISVIRNLKSFNGQCRFQTWLFRIAANKAKDFRERQHAAKRGGGDPGISLDFQSPETGQSIELPDAGAAPDTALLENERVELVLTALEALGEPCREIIQLRYFADLSYEEISAGLSLNVKTVSSRLSKCLGKLEAVMVSKFSGEITGRFPSNH